MDESPDAGSAVYGAICSMRDVFHAGDMHANAGLSGDPREFGPAWDQFTATLECSNIVQAPRAGQGLMWIWQQVVLQHAVNAEEEVGRYRLLRGHVRGLDNGDLLWLVTHGWERGAQILKFKRPRISGLALLLEVKRSPIQQLRELASQWSSEELAGRERVQVGSSEDRWRADFPMQLIGKLLLSAVDGSEIESKWFDDHEFRDQVLRNVDSPSGLASTYLAEASGHALFHLVKRFERHVDESNAMSFEAAALADSRTGSKPNLSSPLHELSPAAQSPSGALKLFGPQHGVLLNNVEHPKLTLPQYDVLSALCAASDRGLSRAELVAKSKRGGAIRTLKNLRASDSGWANLIQLGGVSGGRYRVL